MIDVLLSVKNGGGYLRESIESILNQTYKEFVLYIIDDASTDNSSEIIRSFDDKRIKFIKNKFSRGLTKNLNFLLKNGKNELVARQDADDISHSVRFEKQINFLKKNNLDLIGSNANLIDAKGNLIGKRVYQGKNIKKDLFKFNMFLHSSWFGKRRVFEKLKGYDEKFKFAQDYDFLLRAIKKYKLNICPEKLIDFRWRSDSLSLKHLKEQQKFAMKARLNAISRGDYSWLNYIYMIRPLISFLMPQELNKYIYKYLLKQ